jgi:hypothetical protein
MSCQLEISDLESHITWKLQSFTLLSTSHLLVLRTCIISGHETVELFLFQYVASLMRAYWSRAPPKCAGVRGAGSAFPISAISDSPTIPSHVHDKVPSERLHVSWMGFDA